MTRLSITTAPKGAALSRSSPARRQRRALRQAQDGLLPERLISFGSSCYFPAALLALLLLLSLDLPKHPLRPPPRASCSPAWPRAVLQAEACSPPPPAAVRGCTAGRAPPVHPAAHSPARAAPLCHSLLAAKGPYLDLLPKQFVAGGCCLLSVAAATLPGSRPGTWDPEWLKEKRVKETTAAPPSSTILPPSFPT